MCKVFKVVVPNLSQELRCSRKLIKWDLVRRGEVSRKYTDQIVPGLSGEILSWFGHHWLLNAFA